VERRSFDPQGRHLGLTDFDPSGILASVQCSLDTQSLIHTAGNLASFLRGRHPKTVMFRYYLQEQ
jgi:hypothetical protein